MTRSTYYVLVETLVAEKNMFSFNNVDPESSTADNKSNLLNPGVYEGNYRDIFR